MIKGFEEYTKDLSDYERDTLLPLMVAATRSKIGKASAIKNITAVQKLREAGYIITPARFRKIMHVIRVSGMVPGVVATSKGYYIATSSQELEDYIISLDQRINHIQNLRNAIHNQWIEKYYAEKKPESV